MLNPIHENIVDRNIHNCDNPFPLTMEYMNKIRTYLQNNGFEEVSWYCNQYKSGMQEYYGRWHYALMDNLSYEVTFVATKPKDSNYFSVYKPFIIEFPHQIVKYDVIKHKMDGTLTNNDYLELQRNSHASSRLHPFILMNKWHCQPHKIIRAVAYRMAHNDAMIKFIKTARIAFIDKENVVDVEVKDFFDHS